MSALKKRILYIVLVSFVVVGIDLILNTMFNFYYIVYNKKIIIDVVYLFVLISISSYTFRSVRNSFIILLFTSILIGVAHYKFFYNQILPFEWHLVFVSFSDVLNALSNNLPIVLFLIAFFIIAIYYVIKFSLPIKNKQNIAIFSSILLVFLLLLPMFSHKRITTFLPSNKHLTYFNVLFSFERAVYEAMFFNDLDVKYKDYKITKINKGKKLVILVIGESLNYKRMHMYGWDINNTSLLEKFAKNNKKFIYKKAIASAPETLTSIVSFMYMKREPRNINILRQNNLIEMAKENGYKVVWLSMQEDRGSLVPKFVNESNLSLIRKDFKRKYDDELLKKLKNIKLNNKKTLIVFHLRANHYYYEDYTPKEFYKFDIDKSKLSYHDYMVNSYMNSVLFVDRVLYDIFNYSKKYKSFSVYFTSDHGEMLGYPEEKGRYLHLILTKYDVFVPFFYFSDTHDKNLSLPYYPHYEISKMVAKDLGYKVINPNEKKDIYYINAPQLDGSGGYIKYNLSKWNDK